MLVPAANRFAYLPRTAPEKSYSGLISSGLSGLAAFFILLQFTGRCPPCADDAYIFADLRVRYNEEPPVHRLAEREKPKLGYRVFWVWNGCRERILEDADGFLKRHSVLSEVGCRLLRIVDEVHGRVRSALPDSSKPNACCSAAAARTANSSTPRCMVLRGAVRWSSFVSWRAIYHPQFTPIRGTAVLGWDAKTLPRDDSPHNRRRCAEL